MGKDVVPSSLLLFEDDIEGTEHSGVEIRIRSENRRASLSRFFSEESSKVVIPSHVADILEVDPAGESKSMKHILLDGFHKGVDDCSKVCGTAAEQLVEKCNNVTFLSCGQGGDAGIMYKTIIPTIVEDCLQRLSQKQSIHQSQDASGTAIAADVSFIEFVGEEMIDLLSSSSGRDEESSPPSDERISPSVVQKFSPINFSEVRSGSASSPLKHLSRLSGSAGELMVSESSSSCTDNLLLEGSRSMHESNLTPNVSTRASPIEESKRTTFLSSSSTAFVDQPDISRALNFSPIKPRRARSQSLAYISEPLGLGNTSSVLGRRGSTNPQMLASSRQLPPSTEKVQSSLRVRRHPHLGNFIEGSMSLSVVDMADFDRALEHGLNWRLDRTVELNKLSHCVLKIKFHIGNDGESAQPHGILAPVEANKHVTTTSLTLVDIAVPPETVKQFPPAAGDAQRDACLKPFNTLKKLSNTIFHETPRFRQYAPQRPTHQIPAPRPNSKFIRAGIKKESQLTQYIADDLDGNAVLYVCAIVPRMVEVVQKFDVNGATFFSAGKHLPRMLFFAEKLSHIVCSVDPGLNERKVEVTTQALEKEIRTLQTQLKEAKERKEKAGHVDEDDEETRQMKIQLENHTSHVEQLQDYVKSGMDSTQALRRRAEVKRRQLDLLNSKLHHRQTIKEQTNHVSKELEDVLVSKEEDHARLRETRMLKKVAATQMHFAEKSLLRIEKEKNEKEAVIQHYKNEKTHHYQKFCANFFRSFLQRTKNAKQLEIMEQQCKQVKSEVGVLNANLTVKRRKCEDLEAELNDLNTKAENYEHAVADVALELDFGVSKKDEHILKLKELLRVRGTQVDTMKTDSVMTVREAKRFILERNEWWKSAGRREGLFLGNIAESKSGVVSDHSLHISASGLFNPSVMMEDFDILDVQMTLDGVQSTTSVLGADVADDPMSKFERDFHALTVYRSQVSKELCVTEDSYYRLVERLQRGQSDIVYTVEDVKNEQKMKKQMDREIAELIPEVAVLEQEVASLSATNENVSTELCNILQNLDIARSNIKRGSSNYKALCMATAEKVIPLA